MGGSSSYSESESELCGRWVVGMVRLGGVGVGLWWVKVGTGMVGQGKMDEGVVDCWMWDSLGGLCELGKECRIFLTFREDPFFSVTRKGCQWCRRCWQS